MWNSIDAALTRLERHILPPAEQTPVERYDRLRRIGVAIFRTLAAEYQYEIDETVSLDVHIEKLKEANSSPMPKGLWVSKLKPTYSRGHVR